MILIVSWPHDDHAQAVMRELDRRGVAHFLLDLADLPLKASVSVRFDAVAMSSVVTKDGRTLDLASVETVWLRRLSTPTPGRLHDEGFAVSECHNLLVGLAQALRGKRWVNPLHALALDGGYGKVRQLQAAQGVGLEIPKTLMTNDPEEARCFLETVPAAIYKPFASREAFVDGEQRGLFASQVTGKLRSALGAVRYAPVILQEEIPKQVDLRVTVMGERVFAIEVHSQERAESRTDYRRHYMDVTHRVHDLPPLVAARLRALNRDLGLAFSTCDLALTPDGRYVCFEANQAGMFLWCGAKTGLDLVSPFCDLLEGKAAARPLPGG